MNKLEKIFDKCRKENRSAMIVFCSCGFPDSAVSEMMIEKAIEAGSDIIELGVPFSDPMADGPVIQEASHQAIRKGITLEKILNMTERISARHPETGFILFSYLNVLLNYGLESLTARLEKIGADGILSVDTPFEEREEIDQFCRAHHLDLINLVSPATDRERMKKIVTGSRGFIYYVSSKGVTGNSSQFSGDLETKISELKTITPLPVAVGFGISSPQDVQFMSRFTDGFIIGSASIKIFLNAGKEPVDETMKRYYNFLKSCSECSICR